MFGSSNVFDFLNREIDEAATAQKAKGVLKNYTRIRSMANEKISVGTSNLSKTGYIKRKGSNSDAVGNSVARKVTAEQESKEIERALEMVSNEYKRLLKIKYDKRGFAPNIEIYMALGLSESMFYKRLRKGEIQFAEAYKGGMLLVFKE